MAQINVFVIDPFNNTITPQTIENSRVGFTTTLGENCQLLETYGRIGDDYVTGDEMGLLQHEVAYSMFNGAMYPGRLIIHGLSDCGTETSATVSLQTVQAKTRFLSQQEQTRYHEQIRATLELD